MSQAYILRRDGRDYQANDLEAMRRWCQDGRVLPTDMVFSPKYQTWYRARDLRELRSAFPDAEAVPPAAAPQQFWLRKGEHNYAADSLETILGWASEGNISPDDFIFHPSYGKWFRAGDSPQLVNRFPPHIGHTPAFLPMGEDPMSLQAGRRATPPGHTALPVQPVERPVAKPAARPVYVRAERADSVERTVMDFQASDLRKQLEKMGAAPADDTKHPAMSSGAAARHTQQGRAAVGAQDAGSVALGTTGWAKPADDEQHTQTPRPVPSTPRPAAHIADSAEQPKPAHTLAGVSAVRHTYAAPTPSPVARPQSAAPAATAPQIAPIESKPAPSKFKPAPVESKPAPVQRPAAEAARSTEVDEDARFNDRFGIMKPFYDVARAFVVTRDLRPGELLEASCKLPTSGEDLLGMAKSAIYHRLHQIMLTHLAGPATEIASKLKPDEVAGYRLFFTRARTLISVFQQAAKVVGQKPPERVVIGNAARPKMTPGEQEALLRIDAALKGLISVRVKANT